MTALLLFLLVMGLVLVINALNKRSELQPITGGATTPGTVVGFTAHDERSWTYSPEVQFTTSSGQQVIFHPPNTQQRPAPNEPVRVSYNPTRPSEAHDLSETKVDWTVELISGSFIILISVAMGLFVHRAVRRRLVMLQLTGSIGLSGSIAA